uniref:Uncharacterized protein n=1 Tax=Echeneis naucrates TaxID=173247 RepID=A0A665VPI7_ECHNA
LAGDREEPRFNLGQHINLLKGCGAEYEEREWAVSVSLDSLTSSCSAGWKVPVCAAEEESLR